MKIKYKFDFDTYGKVLNETYGVIKLRNSFKKNKNAKLKTLFEQQILRIIFDLFVVIFCIINFINFKDSFFLFASILMSLCLVYLLLYFYVKLSPPKNFDDSVNFLEFTEEGFSDNTKGSKIFKSWDKFDFVVIGDKAITFILKDDIWFFFVPISCEREIKKSLKKYCPGLEIMDKRRIK